MSTKSKLSNSKFFYKIILIKFFFICSDKTLNLKCNHLAHHISGLTRSFSYNNTLKVFSSNILKNWNPWIIWLSAGDSIKLFIKSPKHNQPKKQKLFLCLLYLEHKVLFLIYFLLHLLYFGVLDWIIILPLTNKRIPL